MPRRHYSDRAPLGSSPTRDDWERRQQRTREPRFRSDLDRDFAAMKRVWQMIRTGAVRMIGEVGRQY
ncbi:MAG: hypothetical protein CL862_08525 [Cyanobium sp. NAT70]|nr:hypothetical protein [Cyanobium sp. NAT70]